MPRTRIDNPRTRINNKGEGDCMYYSYGISLMYYLRAKASKVITGSVFNNLGLKDEDIKTLNDLLKQKKNFSSGDLGTIQNILGPILRNVNAEATKKEFKADPISTSLYTAAIEGLENSFKKSLGNDYSFIKSDFTDPLITQAEIFSAANLGTKKAMDDFAIRNSADVKAKFTERLPIVLAAKQAEKLCAIIKIDIDPSRMSTDDLETFLQKKSPQLSLKGSPAIITYNGDHYFAAQDGERNIRKITTNKGIPNEYAIKPEKINELSALTSKMTSSSEPFVFEMADEAQLKSIQNITNRKTGPLSILEEKYIKQNLITSIISEKTLKFFSENEDFWLNKYISHLKKRFIVWGTVDDLNRLHSSVCGERKETDALGKIVFNQDCDISLGINNPSSEYINYRGEPDIVLCNENNRHWTSLIADSHLADDSTLSSNTSSDATKEEDRIFTSKLQECEKLIYSLREKDKGFDNKYKDIINQIATQLDKADVNSLGEIANILKDIERGMSDTRNITELTITPTTKDFLDVIIERNNDELIQFKDKYKFSDDSEVYKKLELLVSSLNFAIMIYKNSNKDGHAKVTLIKEYSIIIDTNILEVKKLPEIKNEAWVFVAVKKLIEVFCDILSNFSSFFKGRAFTQTNQVEHFKNKIEDIKAQLEKSSIDEHKPDSPSR